MMTRENVREEMRKLGADEGVIAELMSAVDSMPGFGKMSIFCCVPDYMIAVAFCKKAAVSGVPTPLHPTAVPMLWLGVSSRPTTIGRS